VADFGVDVAQGLAHLLDLASTVAFEVLDARPDDGQRGPQLVARVGGELTLALERRFAPRHRSANGDERPARVEVPGEEGKKEGGSAAQD
jgi:hypothetical protein